MTDPSSLERYVRVEAKELKYLEQKRLMLQVIDVSDSIRYDESKEQNQMLSILNATVSHELRNPLNAITGQNVQKEGLYGKIQKLLAKLEAGESTVSEMVEAMKGLMGRLEESLKI
mmetsp:Transcript_8094/g.12464  ORF Transcript_8094/g.12464 Transcript_8094/m.12464 type:complete len:116 (+) Transcript_8094:593-940(+)